MHYPELERHNVEIALLVELESQRLAVEKFVSDRHLKPEVFAWIPDSDWADGTIPFHVQDALDWAEVYGIVVSSEPSSHMPFIR